MRVKPECIPCSYKQVFTVSKEVTDDESKQVQALAAAARRIEQVDLQGAPAEILPLLLREAQAVLGVDDPYIDRKRKINDEILALLPGLEEQVHSSDDPLHTALLFAVAGNIIDLGIIPEYDLVATIRQVFEMDFAINDYADFRELAKKARNIVYLGDNSGEIVLDRLVVSQLSQWAPVTYVVKGGPILNDATIDDARQVKMEEISQVIDNGSSYPGTVLRDVSPEFKKRLEAADLIVSKGQANYETLDELAGPLFFILRAKCDYVADTLGVKLGDVVIKKSDVFQDRVRF